MKKYIVIVILVMAFLAFGVPAKGVFAASNGVVNGVCEFYYGGHSTTAVNRIVAANPEFLVINTPAGMYHENTPIQTYINAGIKVFSYIAIGYCAEWQYTPSEPIDNTYATIMSLIDGVAAEGTYGVFLDEAPYGLYVGGRNKTGSPSASWRGHNLKEAIDRARSHGLKVMLGRGDPRNDTNLFYADYVLTDEWYGSTQYPETAYRPDSYSPVYSEVGHLSQCIVIGGAMNERVTNANMAAKRTNTALAKGFRAAYHCASYGSMSSWFENYIALVNEITPTPTPTPTPMTVTISVSGPGTTNPIPGTYGPYTSGFRFSVQATPSSGYNFDRWAGDISSTANPVSFQVNSNINVQAIFTPDSGSSSSTNEDSVSLYESYTASNDQDNLYGAAWKGQTFTPAITHTISKISLPLLRQGSPSGNVVVSIRKTDANGLPTGGDLATGSIACSTLTTAWNPITWYDFNLGSGYQLEAGTKYALLIRAPSMTTSIYYWYNTAGTYSKGEVLYSNNGGTSWAKGGSYSGWDAAFKEWGY
jgi:hypothetical protein